jgi:methionyl-tRNA synthetase
MPASAAAMLKQLGQNIPDDGPPTRTLEEEADAWGALAPGTALASASNLFPRMEREASKNAAGDKRKAPKASKT